MKPIGRGKTPEAAIADAARVLKSGDAMTGALLLSGDPTQALQAATKQYTDAAATARVPLVDP